MNNLLIQCLTFYLLLIVSALSVQAQSYKHITVKQPLSVGVTGSEPFVFSQKDKGIAVEIWDRIARENSWNYQYVPFENVEDALRSLYKGNLDLVVGPIGITSDRLESITFSQPFYNSSISILSRTDNQSLWQKIHPFFSLRLLIAVLIFLMILGGVGTLLWMTEHKKSPKQFPKDPMKGIGNGMWLAIVTMSTTGYGDKYPVTLPGRIITGIWMIISLIFATSMVAGIASVLTLTSLNSTALSTVEQLPGHKVATVSDSPSAAFLKKYKVQVIDVNNLDDAITKLKNKEVDAIVYDRPELLYYLKNNKNTNLSISKAEYYKQGYGFAFPLHSSLVTDCNRSLLELAENQEIDRIVHYYIQKDE